MEKGKKLSVVQNCSELKADLAEMRTIHEGELLGVGKALGGVASVLVFLSEEDIDDVTVVDMGLAKILECCENRIEECRLAAAKIVEKGRKGAEAA